MRPDTSEKERFATRVQVASWRHSRFPSPENSLDDLVIRTVREAPDAAVVEPEQVDVDFFVRFHSTIDTLGFMPPLANPISGDLSRVPASQDVVRDHKMDGLGAG